MRGGLGRREGRREGGRAGTEVEQMGSVFEWKEGAGEGRKREGILYDSCFSSPLFWGLGVSEIERLENTKQRHIHIFIETCCCYCCYCYCYCCSICTRKPRILILPLFLFFCLILPLFLFFCLTH